MEGRERRLLIEDVFDVRVEKDGPGHMRMIFGGRGKRATIKMPRWFVRVIVEKFRAYVNDEVSEVENLKSALRGE